MKQVTTILVAFLILLAALPETACSQRRGYNRGSSSGDYTNPPLAKDDDEKRMLSAMDEIRQGPGYANVPPNDGRFLRQMVEMTNAKRVVEIGTSTGESAVWMAMGLRKTGGKLITHEIDAGRARIARENFKRAGVDQMITLIEGDAHETVAQHREPIDILFLDADKDGYIDYLNKLLPLVRPGGIVIAHNMSAFMADPRYLEAITKNPDLETSFMTVSGDDPIAITLKKR